MENKGWGELIRDKNNNIIGLNTKVTPTPASFHGGGVDPKIP
jgi:hypothetical protein